MDLKTEIINGHGYLGYVVAAAVLGSMVRAAVGRSKGTTYSEGPARLAGLLLAVQFVYGLLVYVIGEYWAAGWSLAYVHPLLMLSAVGVAGAATARAKRADTPQAAWTAILVFHGAATLLVILGIGAALGG